MPDGIPSGIGTAYIPRETYDRSTDEPQTAYAPITRDYVAKPGDPVPDPGYQIYVNEDWRTEHHNMDQLIKLGLQMTVGPQYAIVGIRRGPRVTWLIANPWVPSRETKPGVFTEEELRGRIGDAAYLDAVPNMAIRRDRRLM
jgi:hypothetical protein